MQSKLQVTLFQEYLKGLLLLRTVNILWKILGKNISKIFNEHGLSAAGYCGHFLKNKSIKNIIGYKLGTFKSNTKL